jgi:hypothetical protein
MKFSAKAQSRGLMIMIRGDGSYTHTHTSIHPSILYMGFAVTTK